MTTNEQEETERARLLDEFARTRSDAARDALAESFLPLADFFANRYANRSAEIEDLRQVARIGLLNSIERFDPSVGVRFSTFAGRTIDGELKHWFRDKTWSMRVPRSIKENVQAVSKSQQKLEQRLRMAPTAVQIAEDIPLDIELVIEALEARSSYRPARLDVPVTESGSQTLGEVLLANDTSVDKTNLELTITSLLDTVPDRERLIIEMRYFEDLSQQEIANRVDLSQMQVSRIIRKTLGQLQETLRNELDD